MLCLAGTKAKPPAAGGGCWVAFPSGGARSPAVGGGSAAKDQPALVALVSRSGEVVVEVAPDVRQATVKPVFERIVAPGSAV